LNSTLSPVCTGLKRHGQLCWPSAKLTVLNSTLSPVCTGLKRMLCMNSKDHTLRPHLLLVVYAALPVTWWQVLEEVSDLLWGRSWEGLEKVVNSVQCLLEIYVEDDWLIARSIRRRCMTTTKTANVIIVQTFVMSEVKPNKIWGTAPAVARWVALVIVKYGSSTVYERWVYRWH